MNDVFMPLVGLLIGGVDLGKLNIVLKAATETTEAVTLGIGTFLSTIIDFVLVAFVIFLMVKTINRFHKKKEEEPPAQEEPAAPTTEELLTEIRDLLKDKQ